jgi:hypothetical protein
MGQRVPPTAWYVMDGVVFPDDLAASGAASMAMGVGGLAGMQRVVATKVGGSCFTLAL